jgi:outer membrane immunogenic protein
MRLPPVSAGRGNLRFLCHLTIFRFYDFFAISLFFNPHHRKTMGEFYRPYSERGNCVMRKPSLMLFAAAVIHLAANQYALAADIARRGYPPPVYIPPPVPIPYIWTGCYVGGNVGGAWSSVDVTGVGGVDFSANNSGFAGGGQIGCDYQWDRWVIGFRDMLDATSLSNSGNFSTVPFTGTVNSRTRWFDTLTARGGYLLTPQVLLYAQGGAAWTNTDITFNSGGSQVGDLSNNHTGWTLGAGVEWMFAPHWSVFAEYNFMGFSTQSAIITGCGGTCTVNANGNANVQDVVAGVNYKF